MADKHDYPDAADRHERLRRSARDMLDRGVTPRSSSGTLSAESLQLLYQHASTPESAADALRLLHELQTHQVELDLLYEQLQENEQEITKELAHYKSLFELAPAAYLVVTSDGGIIEGNQCAGMLFGLPAGQLAGKALNALLAPGQQAQLKTLLSNPRKQAPGVHVVADVSVGLADGRTMTLSAKSATTGNNFLIILTEAAAHSAES